MRGQKQFIFPRLVKGPRHHLVIDHRIPVIGGSHDPGPAREGLEMSKLLPLAAFGDANLGVEVDASVPLGERDPLLEVLKGIKGGVGIGLADHGRITTQSSRPGSRGDSFLAGLVEVPQVAMHVDEARDHDLARGLQQGGTFFFNAGGDVADAPVFDKYIEGIIKVEEGINHSPTSD